MLNWAFNYLIKIIITVACGFTLQSVSHKEGYTIPLSTIIISSLLLILMIRIWAPKSEPF